MDFTKFDARKAAAVGAWLHIKHPATGELLYDGDDVSLPCRILVEGSESPQAQSIMRKLNKARAKDDITKKTIGEMHADLCAMALPLVKQFENINKGDHPCTLDDCEWFLNLQVTNGQEGEQSFAEQIVNFAFKRANYLGNAQES